MYVVHVKEREEERGRGRGRNSGYYVRWDLQEKERGEWMELEIKDFNFVFYLVNFS